MSEPEEASTIPPRPCGKGYSCRRCSAPSATECGSGRCCGKTVEYVVIDSFVWPPWPESPDED